MPQPQTDAPTPSVQPVARRGWPARWLAGQQNLLIGLAVAVLVHGVLFCWPRGCSTPPTVRTEPYVPTLELAAFPLREPEKSTVDELATVHHSEAPELALNPPMQEDVPQLVPIDAFVQPIEPPRPPGIKTRAFTAIPTGGWGRHHEFKVFDPAMLDQSPVPTLQIRPEHPEYLRRKGIKGRALVEFTVDATGRVRDALCLEATDPDFGVAAVTGVNRWRFRPGRKSGHPVASRLRQLFIFSFNE